MGNSRMAGDHVRPGLKVALIQGSIDSEMKTDPDQVQIGSRAISWHFPIAPYDEHQDLDLIVWPETMFREPLRSYTPDVQAPEGVDWTKADLDSAIDGLATGRFGYMGERYQGPHALGHGYARLWRGTCRSLQLGRTRRAQRRSRRDRYDKMRPIMFGEYVPLGSYFPWLYRLTPLADGLDPGEAARSLSVGDVRVAPNICFETLCAAFHSRPGGRAARRGDRAGHPW